MKLKVLQQFQDKFNHSTIYSPSQIIEIEDKKRCEDMIRRGLCEAIQETPEEEEADTDTTVVDAEPESEVKKPAKEPSKSKTKTVKKK